MNVNRYKNPVSDTEDRYRVVVETDPCTRGTILSRTIRHELLSYIATDPAFSQCGGVDFHKARIWHDGEKWCAEFEAVVPRQ